MEWLFMVFTTEDKKCIGSGVMKILILISEGTLEKCAPSKINMCVTTLRTIK